MRKITLGMGCWLILCSFGAMSAELAGYVTRIRGTVVDATAGDFQLSLGDALHVGDRLLTGAEARLEAKMADGMTLTLGAETEFHVKQVMGVTPQSQNSIFGLIKGAFRAATPAPPPATHTKPVEPCRVETPVATIGIRGTVLWGGFNLQNSGSETLDVVMLEGKGIYVENAAGQRVELTQPKEGTTVKGQTGAAPALKSWGQPKLDAALATVAW